MITRITFSTAKTRRKPQAGDVKHISGKVWVRQQVMSQGCYCVHGRRPVYEWVLEQHARDTYRTGWVQPSRKKPQP